MGAGISLIYLYYEVPRLMLTAVCVQSLSETYMPQIGGLDNNALSKGSRNFKLPEVIIKYYYHREFNQCENHI